MPSPIPKSIFDLTAIEATCAQYNLSPTAFHALHTRSVAAKATAYCPYSQFRVGASLLSSPSGNEEGNGEGNEEGNEKFFDGANVENAAYPVGTCAERVALAKAVTEGHRRIKALAVATDISPPATPCGMCRQFIREFCDLQMPIIMFDKDDMYIVLRLEELLPLSFGPEALPRPVFA